MELVWPWNEGAGGDIYLAGPESQALPPTHTFPQFLLKPKFIPSQSKAHCRGSEIISCRGQADLTGLITTVLISWVEDFMPQARQCAIWIR